MGYFDTARTSNGGAEAINGLIELHPGIAPGFRDPANDRLRMLLIAAGYGYDPDLIREEPRNAPKMSDPSGMLFW